MNLSQLTELKEKIEKGKIKLAELRGQQQSFLKRLKEEFKCYSIEEASIKIKTMEEDLEKSQINLKEKENNLKAKFPNLFK